MLTLYDEVIRVPLMARWPGRVPAGARCRKQARMIDVMPTILDLVGLPVDGDVKMGRSLAPLFTDEGGRVALLP